MELVGGIILGVTLLFSLLAFNPTSSSISDWISKEITAFNARQTASIGAASANIGTNSRKQTLSLFSTAFANGSTMPTRYSCDSTGVSPALSISDVPKEAQSLVLIMEDIDAPKGAGVHWLAFNIPPTMKEIPEGKEPVGRAGKNSWGKVGYGVLCPSSGEHRYIFRVYALSRTLALPVGSTKEKVLAEMKRYVLSQAELVGRYKRATK